MNFNTFAGYIGGTGRNQIASQTLAATTETEFKVNTDNGSGAIAVLSLPSGTSIVGSSNPLGPDVNQAILWQSGRQALPFGSARPSHNSQSFDFGRPFLLRICGVATPASDAANSIDIKVYFGATKSGTLMADTGAVAQATSTTPVNFLVELEMFWSLAAGTVRGQQWYSVGGTTPVYNTWKAASNQATAATLASVQFCASATWGNAVGGVVAVSEFSLSQL